MPSYTELTLFEVKRDLALFRSDAVDLDSPVVAVVQNAARDLAAQRGWSAATLRGVERGLRVLLAHHPIGNPVPYSDIIQLSNYSTNISLDRTADVLTELGLLHDDRKDGFDGWITRQLADLPVAIHDELRIWIDVLSGRAPRSRARSAASVRRYVGYVLPHIRLWSATYTSLREITSNEVVAVLDTFDGNHRTQQLGALRSLFTTLKARRMIFRNPTSGLRGRRVSGPVPPPLPDSLLAAVADAARDPERRLLFVLAALQALRPSAMRVLRVADIDLQHRQLTVGGHSRPIDPITYEALVTYLRHRRIRWPLSPNPYLLVSAQTAHQQCPVTQTWTQRRAGELPVGLDRIRTDRYLEELLAHGPDPLHCQAVFGVSNKTAIRYADAAAALLGTSIDQAFKAAEEPHGVESDSCRRLRTDGYSRAMTDATSAIAGDYTATLPTKRMAAGALFFNPAGNVLIVQPAYKDYWEIPGGAVEANESPYAACCREIAEELGLTRKPTPRILAIDWVPPQVNRTEGLMTVFDGGDLHQDEIAAITLPERELRGYAFCTIDEAAQRLSDRLARRLAASVRARAAGTTVYLEDGYPQGAR